MKKSLAGVLFLCLTTSSFASLAENENENKALVSLYNLNKTINNIKELKINGNRLGLFIGRTSDEVLPDEEDRKLFPEDKDIIWISGDCGEGKYIDHKPHIVMDFNDDLKVSLLNGLFNKVVVDISTWKFFVGCPSDPVARFFQLLIKNPSSTLMFESAFQYVEASSTNEPEYGIYSYGLPQKTAYLTMRSSICDKVQQEIQDIFNDAEREEEKSQIKRLGLEEIRKETGDNTYETDDLQDIKNTYLYNLAFPKALKEAGLPEKDPVHEIDHASIVREKTIEHLKKFFKDVTLIVDQPYYANRYQNKPAYFIAKDPR